MPKLTWHHKLEEIVDLVRRVVLQVRAVGVAITGSCLHGLHFEASLASHCDPRLSQCRRFIARNKNCHLRLFFNFYCYTFFCVIPGKKKKKDLDENNVATEVQLIMRRHTRAKK